MAVVTGVVTVASWSYGYQPLARAVRQDRSRVQTMKRQVEQLDAMVQAAGGEAAWLSRHQQQLAQLRSRWPDQAQLPQLLNAFVDQLKSHGGKLLNVSQGNVEPVQANEQPVLIEGVPCDRLPVTVTVESRYLVLLGALEPLLNDTFPVLITLDRLELRTKGDAGSLLEAVLQFSLYVKGHS